jgi:hypothetical protein
MSVNFSNEYDPGKAAYLRNANFQVSPQSDFREVQPMPGTCLRCVFGQGEHAAECQKAGCGEIYSQGQPCQTDAEREALERRMGLVARLASPVKPEIPRAPAIHIKKDPLADLKPTPHLDGLARQARNMEQAIQAGRFRHP